MSDQIDHKVRTVDVRTSDGGRVEIAPYDGQWFLTIEGPDGRVEGQCRLTEQQALAVAGRHPDGAS